MVATTNATHFGVGIVNITVISIGIYFTLKYNNAGFHILIHIQESVRRIIVIAVVWLYPSIWAITLAYITRNIPSLRCQLYTDDFEPPNSATGLLELFQIVVYVSRIFLIDTVCRILVVVIRIASYRLFVNSTINPPEGLARLLPVLMTIMTSVVNLISDLLLVGLNNGFGGITVTVNQFESSSFYYTFQPYASFSCFLNTSLLVFSYT